VQVRWFLATGALLLASPAWAQEPALVASPQIDEIVVTAQRAEELLRRAALPVAVLSPELLADAGATKPFDLSHLVPALQVAGLSGSFTVYYMRGVGNFSGNSLQDPAVTFNFDGVSIGRPSSTTGFFYDLERIEVLKGPQGTLYGRNATGGAINVLPRRPELGEQGGAVSAEIADYNHLRVDGALNVPRGSQAALRAAAMRVEHDGYMNDGADDQDDIAARVSFLFEPSAALSISLVADYFRQKGKGPGSTPIALGPDNRFGLASPQAGAFYMQQRHALGGRTFNPIPAVQRIDNEFWGLNATIDVETPAGVLTLIPAYRQALLDNIFGATGLTLTTLEEDKQASFEARLASNPHAGLRTILGALVFEETNDVPLFVPNSQYNLSIQRPHSRTESASVYGRLTFDVTDDVRATFGARYTSDLKYLSGSFQSFNRLCTPVPTASCPNAVRFPVDQLTPPIPIAPGAASAIPVFNPADGTLTVGFAIPANEKESFSQTTWRAALEWDVAERSMLYASYETGFKAGGFFFSNDDQTFQPEYVDAITVGWKNRLFENSVLIDIEGFHWLYDDQQVSAVSVDSGGVTNLRTRNVGEATIKGVEVETQWRPAEHTRLSADVQYLDAVYDDFQYVTPLSAGPPVTGCRRTAGASGFVVDCAGKRPPYAPEWTLNLGAEQAFPLAAGGEFVANIRAHYQSETLTGLDFTPLEYQPGYWSADAAVTFNAPGDAWFISLFGRNITDETVVANTFQPPFGAFVVGSLRPPRIVGVRMGARH